MTSYLRILFKYVSLISITLRELKNSLDLILDPITRDKMTLQSIYKMIRKTQHQDILRNKKMKKMYTHKDTSKIKEIEARRYHR